MSDRPLQLIVGADSTIGRALMVQFEGEGQPVLGTTRRSDSVGDHLLHVDLATDLLTWVAPESVGTVWLCAAVTSLAECRAYPDQTHAINVEGVCRVARRLGEMGAQVVFLSSSLVFDGGSPSYEPNSPVCPTTTYGRQKAEAERLLADIHPVVIRLTKVLGPRHPLLMRWRTSLQNGEVIRPYNNRVISPLPLAWVVRALTQLAGSPGIHHLSGDQEIPWSMVGRLLAERIGADAALVRPCEIGEADTGLEPVGKYSTLDMSATLKLLDLEPPSVNDLFDNVIGKSILFSESGPERSVGME